MVRIRTRAIRFMALLLVFFSIYTARGSDSQFSTEASTCNRSIAQCDELQTEFLTDSEANRRFMEEKRYISVGALKKDQAACSSGARGEAYSKDSGCLPQSSNPSTRGCSKYYRCRSDS